MSRTSGEFTRSKRDLMLRRTCTETLQGELVCVSFSSQVQNVS